MKRLIQLLRHLMPALALLLVAVQSTSAACLAPLQAPSPEQMQVAQQQVRDRGFLWRISKGDHTSYLYGTIHVAKLEWVIPGNAVRAAWRATDTLALELNLLDPSTILQVQAGARDFDASSLPVAFTEWVHKQAIENCLDLVQLQTMDPMFQLATITLALARRSGLEAAFGIDLMLTQTAQSASRPIEALETAREQIDALKLDADQTLALAELQAFSAEDQEQAQQVLLKLATAWEHSDFATIDNYEQWCKCVDSPSDREQLKRLIDDRNIRFALRIDALHSAGRKVFAAVGSLHLMGKDKSVPGLLRKQGYTVQSLF